tara:strand:- start:350 stop:505 length:156 start_codon:yes stop_codon:yes gene_type:complete
MRDMYEFTRDAIIAIRENPMEAVESILFMAFLGLFTWAMLWMGAIVTGAYV